MRTFKALFLFERVVDKILKCIYAYDMKPHLLKNRGLKNMNKL